MPAIRVLMIARCVAWPLHLGDRLIVYHLARELRARGVLLDLLAFADTPADWSLENQQHYTPYFESVTLFDAPRRPLPELLRRALLPAARFASQAHASFAPELWREGERRLATTRYDAVHLFGGIQVYEFAPLLRGLKTIITPYESYALLLRRTLAHQPSIVHRLQWNMARHYERWMFSPYDVVTVLSEPDRDELLMLNAALNVRVIPNGIDLSAFPLRDSARDAAHFVFLGNYDYAPNAEAALWLAQDIFPRVRQALPNAQLSLVGNAPPASLLALASDSVTVTGRVPSVAPYLARATAFVCPLRVGAGIKNKALEALAAGCPLIATPLSVDGIHITDGENALVADTAEGIAAAMIRLAQDRALAAQFSAGGRALIEREYTWAHVADDYLTLYTGKSHQTRD